jgi:hypothetical protein
MWALGFGWRRTTAVTSSWDRFLDDAEAEDEAASGSFVATTIVCFVAIDADSIYDPFRRPEYTATALFDSLFFSLRFIVSYTGAALNIDSVHSTIC